MENNYVKYTNLKEYGNIGYQLASIQLIENSRD